MTTIAALPELAALLLALYLTVKVYRP